MTQPLVSIIIPVYNVERFMERCAESLLCQTYQPIEFIFVDDCSTDSSLSILESVIARHQDRNVSVIRLDKNGGLAHSRTVGMDAATGDYLAFCDGDDWTEVSMIQGMVDYAESTGADIVCTPFFINRGDSQSICRYPAGLPLTDINTIPLDALHFAVWNKLFRKSLFNDNGIRPFKGVDCWEDFCMTSRIFTLTNNAVLLDTPYYHYRKGQSSALTASSQRRILEEHLLCADNLSEWFSAKGDDFKSRYVQFLRFMKFTAKIKMLRGSQINVSRWKSTYPEVNTAIMHYHNVPVPYRLMFSAVNILPASFSQSIANLVCRFRR
jgi:glycosyltransferase involved in cell wall biosynthesis